MSLQSNTNNDIFIIPSQSLMQFSGSAANPIVLLVEPSGSVNFVGTTGSILKIMDNLSGSLFSVNNISGLSILEVFSNNQIKMGNPSNYALVVSGSNVIITGSLIDKSSGTKFLVVDTTTGVVHTTGSGGGGGSPTTPGGNPTEIQYNSGSAFGGVPDLVYSSSFGLRATGSFTGSFTGSLLGTSSWAQSASQAISASYINISSSNIATLEVSYATPGVIALLAKTGSGASSAPINSLQYNAGGGLFGGVVSSSYNNINGQLTLENLIATGSLLGTASFATTSSYALTALLTASVSSNTITFTKGNGNQFSLTVATGSGGGPSTTPGGSDTQIQFNSGSAFSGSGNFTFNYTNNTARLTGSLIVTGSAIITGSLNITANQNSLQSADIVNTNNGSSAYTTFQVDAGNGITGSRAAIVTLPKSSTINTYFAGGTNFSVYPISTGDVNRPIKYINSILNTSAASSFEWHYDSGFTLGSTTKKMTLDVPSGILSNSGSIVTSGSLTITSGSTNTSNDCAIYLGASGSVGSWRIAPSGANLVIQKWNGTSYSGGTTVTP